MTRSRRLGIALLVVALAALTNAPSAGAETRQELTAHAQRALKKLYAGNKAARLLGEKAKGVLIFPEIVKAGFMVGGQIGDGVMLKGGKPSGYYNTVAASYGFQAGVQTYGYALFFMNDGALKYLDSSDGFEVGVGPSIVVVDEGVGKSMTSTTITNDVYAFIFNQKGLMGGVGIQGSKITRLSK